MSNNETGLSVVNTTCHLSPIAKYVLSLITYTYTPVIYITVGTACHLLALITFLHQSENSYVYQILVTTCKMVQIVCCTQFYFCFYNLAGQDYSGNIAEGVSWFRKNYLLMWFTCYVSPVLSSALTTVVTCLAAVMTFDRALALSKPTFYFKFENRSLPFVAAFVCYIMGLLLSVETGFRYILVGDSDKYGLQSNPDYSKNSLLYIDSQARNFVRAVGLTTIVAGSSIMFYYLKQRTNKVIDLTQNSTIQQDLGPQLKKKQRTLSIVAIFQAVTVAVTAVLPFVFNVSLFVAPEFGRCEGVMISMVNDLLLQVMNTAEYFVLFWVNNDFRGSVLNIFKRKGTTQQEVELNQHRITVRF